MAAHDERPTSDDEQLGRQLSDFFATVTGRRTEMPPRTPPLGAAAAHADRPVPAPPPAPHTAPLVDVAGNVIRHVNAQMDALREELRNGIEAQLADFREELFEWLQGYGAWQVRETEAVRRQLDEIRSMIGTNTPPSPPPDRGPI